MKKLLRVITMHDEVTIKFPQKNKWTKEEMRLARIKMNLERQDMRDYLLSKIKPKPLPQEFFILEKEYKNRL